jgi:hypothetical protein
LGEGGNKIHTGLYSPFFGRTVEGAAVVHARDATEVGAEVVCGVYDKIRTQDVKYAGVLEFVGVLLASLDEVVEFGNTGRELGYVRR